MKLNYKPNEILFLKKEQLTTPPPNNHSKILTFINFTKYLFVSLLCCALVLFSTLQAQAQNHTQLGADIDGEAVFDRSGYSVSISADGKTVAIGAIDNDGSGWNAGHVRVYKYTATGGWKQLGADIDGEAARDYSGRSVSLSADGKTVAIGAAGNDGSRGHVRVYKYTDTWRQLGADIDGEAADDRSGWSVSLSADGKTVAIGAPGNGGKGYNAGHVRVYKYTAIPPNTAQAQAPQAQAPQAQAPQAQAPQVRGSSSEQI